MIEISARNLRSFYVPLRVTSRETRILQTLKWRQL